MYRLLIVEDELFSRQALQCSVEFLYPDQFEIFSTDNGLDALNCCQQNKPDIVLVDLNIPGISGLNLIHTLRDYLFSGKIIIITAHDRSKYIREALSLGVVSYLLKPLDPDELKQSIDKCLNQLCESREPKRDDCFDSLFSYAQSYLIRDILNSRAPQKLLSDVYGWACDGSLNVSLLVWFPGQKPAPVLSNHYLKQTMGCLGKYFSLMSATIHGYVITFLKTAQTFAPLQLETVLYACLQSLHETFPDCSLILSEFVMTYKELYQTVSETLFLAEHAPGTFLNRNQQPTQIWPADTRFRLRQKFVQRLEEKQTIQLTQYLKRKFDSSEESWAWAALFMEALKQYSPSADLCHVLTIFQSQTRFLLLENYLDAIYADASAKQLSKTERAIRLMEEGFSREITQEDIASQLGLTPTYFSSLFKKETGRSFPQYLAEVRVKYAIQLILSGERDIGKIAADCGCQNKKYFLEIFKKYSGYSFTQFLQNLCKKTEESQL